MVLVLILVFVVCVLLSNNGCWCWCIPDVTSGGVGTIAAAAAAAAAAADGADVVNVPDATTLAVAVAVAVAAADRRAVLAVLVRDRLPPRRALRTFVCICVAGIEVALVLVVNVTSCECCSSECAAGLLMLSATGSTILTLVSVCCSAAPLFGRGVSPGTEAGAAFLGLGLGFFGGVFFGVGLALGFGLGFLGGVFFGVGFLVAVVLLGVLFLGALVFDGGAAVRVVLSDAAAVALCVVDCPRSCTIPVCVEDGSIAAVVGA